MHYIGNELQKRMDLLGIDVSTLSKTSFVSKNMIENIINDKIAYEEIDEFDLSLICNVLHCNIKYFADSKVRKQDLLIQTMDGNMDSIKSKSVKAKIQDFMNDYVFVSKTLVEEQ